MRGEGLLRQSIGKMRALASMAALLVFGTGAVSAQSLGEVAKKEKERRARAASNENGEPVPVIGEEELVSSRGDRVSIMGREADPASAKPESETDTEAGPQLSEAEIKELRATWSRVWPERLAAAEKELELAEDAVYQCQSAAHYVFVPLAVDCEGVYERRAIAEYRVRELRQNRFNWELLLPERPRPPPPR